jgi:hypothetical protein
MKYPGLRLSAVVSTLSQESKVQNRTVSLLVEHWHAVKHPTYFKIIKKKVRFWLSVVKPFACGLAFYPRLIPKHDSRGYLWTGSKLYAKKKGKHLKYFIYIER